MMYSTPVQYDVCSLHQVPDLLQLCMLSSRAYIDIASEILHEEKLAAAQARGVLLCENPAKAVPQPTHIEFRNLGAFIRIIYLYKHNAMTHYLTHINVRYDNTMWIVVPGIEDIAPCENDTDRAKECAVARLRLCMESLQFFR